LGGREEEGGGREEEEEEEVWTGGEWEASDLSGRLSREGESCLLGLVDELELEG
jgi:hypothetical protein